MSTEDHHYTISAGERLLTIGINAIPHGQSIAGSVSITTAGKAEWEYRTIQLDKFPVTGGSGEWRVATSKDNGLRSKKFNIEVDSYTRPIYTGIQLRAVRAADSPIAARIHVDGPITVMNDTIEEFRERYDNGTAAPVLQYHAPMYDPFRATDDAFRTQAGETETKTDDKTAADTTKKAEGYSTFAVVLLVTVVGALVYFFAHKKDRKKNLEKLRSATSKGLNRLGRGPNWYRGSRAENSGSRL